MNCPSRVDEQALPRGWNQNPDLREIEAQRQRQYKHQRDHDADAIDRHRLDQEPPSALAAGTEDGRDVKAGVVPRVEEVRRMESLEYSEQDVVTPEFNAGRGGAGVALASGENGAQHGAGLTHAGGGSGRPWKNGFSGSALKKRLQRTKEVLLKFAKFIGPGWMVAVAYIDPGNYATDVAAGASYRFQLLVMILVSNIFAIFLQSLCIKLGSVTGLNLAENCKAHCPPWLNFVLFFFAEAGIIATDIAEVIGTAIALNLLFGLNLVAGCAISIVDVLVILFFYRPSGTMRGLRIFEVFVGCLVLGVVVCFCIQLSYIQVPDIGELFRGYLPSHALIESKGLLQACGILGATVMPHSLYLGSGLVQPRLYEFDQKNSVPTTNPVSISDDIDEEPEKYRPSLAAIRFCLKYSVVELAISLFTFALFVNSAILIVAGASLSDSKSAEDASLFGIHDLLSRSIAPVAGTIFALALLLSGTSAGIVCTIAGQMVWLGQMKMPVKPWIQRLVTRSIAITPSIIIAGAVGKDGLSRALEGSQVALSGILPVVSAPLIYFTCRTRYMTVADSTAGGSGTVNMRNNWITATAAIAIWGLIVIMNVAGWALNATASASGS